MYDRTLFVQAARAAGDGTPPDTSRRLGVARNTAWRLWAGKTAPSAKVTALVELHYGVPATQLVRPAVTPREDTARADA